MEDYEIWVYPEQHMFDLSEHHKIAVGLSKVSADQMIRKSQMEYESEYLYSSYKGHNVEMAVLYTRKPLEPIYAVYINDNLHEYIFNHISAEMRREFLAEQSRKLGISFEIREINHPAGSAEQLPSDDELAEAIQGLMDLIM